MNLKKQQHKMQIKQLKSQSNKDWLFVKNTTDISLQDGEKINIPHTWNNVDGIDGGNDYFRGSCVYKKVFHQEDLPKAQKYYLEINGANSSADLYLNGKKLDEPYIKELTLTSEGVSFPLTVPEGTLFLMGDNRNGSTDSRSPMVGCVDERYVLGVVRFRLTPEFTKFN